MYKYVVRFIPSRFPETKPFCICNLDSDCWKYTGNVSTPLRKLEARKTLSEGQVHC